MVLQRVQFVYVFCSYHVSNMCNNNILANISWDMMAITFGLGDAAPPTPAYILAVMEHVGV